MDDAIEKKIQELAKETHSLSGVKTSLQNQLREIDTRLIQLTGAIVELKKLQAELKGETGETEDRTTNQPGIHGSVHEANESTTSDEGGVEAEKTS